MISVGVSGLKALGDAAQLGLPLFRQKRGTQASENEYGAPIADVFLARIKRQRSPEIDAGRKFEILRHHANHRVCLQVDLDRAANDAAVTAKEALPQTVAQHDDALVPGLVFIRSKGAAEQRSAAE